MLEKILLFIIGCILGSFFWLVAERWPQGLSILRPASHCSSCQTPLRKRDLIPLLSALQLKFRCRDCRHPFSKMSFFAELVSGLFFVFTFPQFLTSTTLLPFVWLLTAFMMALADIRHYILEPKIFYPASLMLWLWHFHQGAAVQWLTVLYCIGISGFLLIFLRGRFGFGDLLLLLSWSPWLNLQQFCLLLIFASSLGLATFGIYYVTQRKHHRFPRSQELRLPFIPFLASGLWLILRFGL